LPIAVGGTPFLKKYTDKKPKMIKSINNKIFEKEVNICNLALCDKLIQCTVVINTINGMDINSGLMLRLLRSIKYFENACAAAAMGAAKPTIDEVQPDKKPT
jgi:hypothetical protein